MRKSGVLLPIFSLPSKDGVGCFSDEAYQFIDFLANAGQSYWQILPLVPPGACNSPYQSYSTFAGNHLFIDLKQLVFDELLTWEELNSYISNINISDKMDYENTGKYKIKSLKLAFERFTPSYSYMKFLADNILWVYDYAEFMNKKEGEPEAFYLFIQFIFDKQWKKLKEYANIKGIKIIGDLPIYVSLDSSDVYFNSELFQLDEDGNPTAIAGCPPDDFSDTGQLWGNPLYNWKEHKKNNYEWWIERIKHCFKLYDVVRIDHFRAFHDYYSIPYGSKTASEGHWEFGPDIDFFNEVEEQLGKLDLVAEDLGYLSPGVHELLRDTGFPGMKILQFAFNGGKDNPYLPENISENYIVYTGTHDNNTTKGWYNNATDWEKEHMRQYVKNENVCWGMIELAMSTKANLCITQMQDFLELDETARTNTPGTCEGNWEWRLIDLPTIKLADKIKELSEKYERI